MDTDRLEYVDTGERFKPHLRASSWNAFTDAANFVKTQKKSERPDKSKTGDRPAIIDILMGQDGGERLTIVGLDTIGIAPDLLDNKLSDEERPLFSGVTPTASHHGKFAILIEEADENEVAIAVAMGVYVVKLWVPAQADWLDRADVDTTDETRLTLEPAGTAQVLWKEAGESTEVWAIVRLGIPQNVSYRGYTLQTIAADGTGNVELYSDPASASTGSNVSVSAHLSWMHGGQEVASGTECIVTWFPRERKWIVTHAACAPSTLSVLYENKDAVQYENKDAVDYGGP